MRYKKGEKVVIVKTRTDLMSGSGLMDIFLGKEMTIFTADNSQFGNYSMEEDNQKWAWEDKMINHEATAKLNSMKKNKITVGSIVMKDSDGDVFGTTDLSNQSQIEINQNMTQVRIEADGFDLGLVWVDNDKLKEFKNNL